MSIQLFDGMQVQTEQTHTMSKGDLFVAGEFVYEVTETGIGTVYATPVWSFETNRPASGVQKLHERDLNGFAKVVLVH